MVSVTASVKVRIMTTVRVQTRVEGNDMVEATADLINVFARYAPLVSMLHSPLKRLNKQVSQSRIFHRLLFASHDRLQGGSMRECRHAPFDDNLVTYR